MPIYFRGESNLIISASRKVWKSHPSGGTARDHGRGQVLVAGEPVQGTPPVQCRPARRVLHREVLQVQLDVHVLRGAWHGQLHVVGQQLILQLLLGESRGVVQVLRHGCGLWPRVPLLSGGNKSPVAATRSSGLLVTESVWGGEEQGYKARHESATCRN